LVALASPWPLFVDAILIGVNGLSRSGRLGVTRNISAELIAAACSRGGLRDCSVSLDVAFSDQSAVLTAALDSWGGVLLPTARAAATIDTPFSMTLAGTSWVVLRAQERRALPAFSNATKVWLGSAPCTGAAVSDDGFWALLRTPSPAAICGSNSTACGYMTLTITNPVTGAIPSYNLSISCPPFCPDSFDAAVATPFAPSTAGVIALGTIPPPVSGGAPVLLPTSDYATAGIYYTLACSATGVFTDPTLSNACVNASDPASLNCAYGTGDACVRCPSGGLCPGGYRLRSRPGFWVAAESSDAVVACALPATTRCVGWDATAGTTACGRGYLSASYLCGACARSYYDAGDGTCASCPVVSSAWEKYRGLLGLIAGLLVLVVVVAGALFVVVKIAGGTLAGLARKVITLGVWAVITVQTLALVARDSSSTSLPEALRVTYSFVSVLTLEVRVASVVLSFM
jgi:hypothetical protein